MRAIWKNHKTCEIYIINSQTRVDIIKSNSFLPYNLVKLLHRASKQPTSIKTIIFHGLTYKNTNLTNISPYFKIPKSNLNPIN